MTRLKLAFAALAALCGVTVAEAQQPTPLAPITVTAPAVDYSRYDEYVKYCLFGASNLRADRRELDAMWYNQLRKERFDYIIARCKKEETPERYAMYLQSPEYRAKLAQQQPRQTTRVATQQSGPQTANGDPEEQDEGDGDMGKIQLASYQGTRLSPAQRRQLNELRNIESQELMGPRPRNSRGFIPTAAGASPVHRDCRGGRVTREVRVPGGYYARVDNCH